MVVFETREGDLLTFDGTFYEFRGKSMRVNRGLLYWFDVLPPQCLDLLYIDLCNFCAKEIPYRCFLDCMNICIGGSLHYTRPKVFDISINDVPSGGRRFKYKDTEIYVAYCRVYMKLLKACRAEMIQMPDYRDIRSIESCLDKLNWVEVSYIRYLYSRYGIPTEERVCNNKCSLIFI